VRWIGLGANSAAFEHDHASQIQKKARANKTRKGNYELHYKSKIAAHTGLATQGRKKSQQRLFGTMLHVAELSICR
jgi:hypothetical protein